MASFTDMIETYNAQSGITFVAGYSESVYAEGNPGIPTGYYQESIDYTVTYEAEHGTDE